MSIPQSNLKTFNIYQKCSLPLNMAVNINKPNILNNKTALKYFTMHGYSGVYSRTSIIQTHWGHKIRSDNRVVWIPEIQHLWGYQVGDN